MRWIAILFLSLTLPSLAFAQADPQQAKIDSATNNAVSGMIVEISRQPITKDIAVRDLLNATHGVAALTSTLKQADQIGGPRWVDEGVCQIRLEIGGQKVADSLLKISNDAGDHSPVKEKTLRAALHGWDRRNFTATGTSDVNANLIAVPPASQPLARIELPNDPPAWVNQFMQADGQNGSELTRLRSARAAEIKAMAALRLKINDLPVTKDATVGQAAQADPTMDQAIDRAVQKAKLTKLDYRSDGGASVQVTVNLLDVWREMDVTRQNAQP